VFCLQVDIGIMLVTLGFCWHLTWHVARSLCTSSAFCNLGILHPEKTLQRKILNWFTS